MQTLTRKIFYILITLLSLFSQITHGQNNYILIDKADSLFKKKNFIQSNKIYDDLFYKKGQYTPRMLLKMAYINEGTGNYAKALYFLNLYNTINPSKLILEKMETIADEYQLKGYEYDDNEYFLLQFYKYYNKIIISLLTIGFLAFIYIVLKRNMNSKIVKLRAVVVGLYLGGVFYIIDSHLFKKAVVTNSHALLLDAPSAGGNLITHVGEGNRLKIIHKEDIWYKVKWNDKYAYIRESNVAVLNH
jgi:hypothetical protein